MQNKLLYLKLYENNNKIIFTLNKQMYTLDGNFLIL